jgi:holo-[acyl-carrier protein] synthase
MPPRPFPLQLGVGIDIIHKPRLRRLILKNVDEVRSLRAFLRRMLTDNEQREFWDRMKPSASLLQSEETICKTVDYLAGRCTSSLSIRLATKIRVLMLSQMGCERSCYQGREAS